VTVTVRHLRPRGEGIAQPTTTVELFFDLVYVFAVTQLSHQELTEPGSRVVRQFGPRNRVGRPVGSTGLTADEATLASPAPSTT
jgi:hypothetical protein